ncbi:hypothetical protein ACUSIJ_21895 [Pseudochelatococcus sp. B33]
MSTVYAPRPAVVRRPAAQIVTRATMPAFRAGGVLDAPAVPDSTLTVVLLLVVLPLFGQTFYYMNQWPAPYYLSKGWPIIVLPLFLRGLMVEKAPIRWLFVLLLSYMVGLTPLMSMIHFGNPFGDAVLTTVEVWPFIYYPAFLGLLLWLRPSGDTLRACVLGLGLATFVLMLFLWIVVPNAWYSGDGINEKFLLYEFERGYRIYMPMFFGMLFVFYLARRFSARMEWWVAAALVVCFVLLLMIYKQRTAIGAAAFVTVLAGCPPRWRWSVALGAVVAAAFGLIALLVTPTGSWAVERFGNSLLVRLESARSVVAFIDDNVLSWAFGMGSVTRFGAVTLGDIVGNDFFFLADLGWLGVVFKYGVIGALLVAGVYVAAWLVSGRNGRVLADPFASALGDYILFTMVTTAIYSPTFLSGEMATVLALSVYLARRAGAAGAPSVHQRSNS